MISIVVPLYNKQKSIGATLSSIVEQSYSNYEVIVVDDGSTDASASIVMQFIDERKTVNDARFRLIKKTNGGVCSARNVGIRSARGRYIALLDADDIWHEDYLKEQVCMIIDFPNAVMWGINYAGVERGKIITDDSTALPKDFRGYVEHYFEMPGRVSDLFCSSSVVIRHEIFEKVGYFDERIRYAEDSDMWFRIIASYPVAFFDRYMVYYQFDAENPAMNNPRLLQFFLPNFVDKYRSFRTQNPIFYRWVNRWAAVHLRQYYFERDKASNLVAKQAVKKLDYDVIPFKYRFLFNLPYPLAAYLNKIDRIRQQRR